MAVSAKLSTDCSRTIFNVLTFGSYNVRLFSIIMPNSSQDAGTTNIITKDQNNEDHYHHCNISINSSSN